MEKKYIQLARRESRLRAEMKELILSALDENNGKITFTPDDEDDEYPVSATLYGKHDSPVIDISAVYSNEETVYADGYNQSNGVFQTEFIIYPEQYSDILHFIGAVLNWSQGVKSEAIEVTILLGPELIHEYEETGEFPSNEWLEDTGGVIDTISYDTEEEMNAFLEGVNFTNGWTDSLVLNETMKEYLNQKREFNANEKQ